MTDGIATGGIRPSVELSKRARNEILLAILLALFLSALDQTIMGTALPTIVSDLHGISLYTWVVTIYLITSTVSGPIYGKLSDLYGRRPILLFGVSLFLVGSALCGLSQDMAQLILFRGIQGLGAGAIFPISLAVIGDLFSPAERGKYQGLFGAVFGIAALIGPALGGFLTDEVSWHAVFFVNLPIGVVSLVIIWRLLPKLRRAGARPDIDYLGVALLTAGLVPILIGLTNAQTTPWGDPGVFAWLLVGALFLVGFVFAERRASEPIVPLELFRSRTFSLSMIAVFLASFGFFAAIIFLPIYFQVVRGESATNSGYALLPFLAGLISASIASGQLVARSGRYKWLTVGALLVVSLGLALFTQLQAGTEYPMLWLWMFVTGVGVGPTLAVYTIIVQNAVPMKQLGAATSDLTLFRQIGGTVGLTLGFTIFRTGLVEQIPGQLVRAGVPQAIVDRIPGGAIDTEQLTSVGGDPSAFLQGVPEQARAALEPLLPAFVTAFDEAISAAIANTFWLGVVASLIAAGVTALMIELPLRTSLHPSVEGAPREATVEGPADLPGPETGSAI